MDKWLNPTVLSNISMMLLKIVFIIFISAMAIRIGKTTIANMLQIKVRSPVRVSKRREATLVKLLQNILTYVVYFIAFVTILSILSINIKGILAGAGILGVAIGFGAQNFVKDVIAGFFIIFEDQFAVGDLVKINQFDGKVEEIGLRTTKVLSATGELYIVPNGNIVEVRNYSIYNNIALLDIKVHFQVNILKLSAMIEGLLKKMPKKYKELINEPKLLGLEQFDGDDLTLRIAAETVPGQKEYIIRELRKELKMLLDEIEYQEKTENHQGE